METRTLFLTFLYTSALSVLIPLTCCILRFKALNRELRALFIYLVVSLVTEIISFVFSINSIPNYIVRHIFTILECTLITYIYLHHFKAKPAGQAIRAAYFAFVILAFIVLVVANRINSQDSVLASYEACFFIVLSCITSYRLMEDLTVLKLSKHYFFWINAAFLIYFSMEFFLFLFDWYLEKCRISLYYLLYSFHLSSSVALNILLSVGVWKVKRL